MKIEDGVIVEATTNELFDIWLQEWSDIFSFRDYMWRVELAGTKIVKE